MSGLFNFFKNIVSGIFGFLGGLFKGKSEDGFYLELKEGSAGAAAPVVAPVATPPSPAAPGKKSTRAEKLAALAAEGQTNGSVAAAPTASVMSTPQPVAATASQEPAITTFADQYLLPLATPTRRPGANMSSFLDMARQAKVPN